MQTYYTGISLFALLASALALPHDDPCRNVARLSTTVVVTITRTVEEGASLTTVVSSATKWTPISQAAPPASSATLPSISPPTPSSAPPNGFSTSARTTCPHTTSHIISPTPSPSPPPNKQESHKDDFHMLPVSLSSASRPTSDVQWSNEDQVVHTYDTDVHIRREANSAARHRSTPLWHRFFAAAHPLQIVRDGDFDADDDDSEWYAKTGEECIACEKGRDVVCIGKMHFGYCDEGCVEPRRLGDGMKCVDGKIWGAKRMDG